MGVREGRGGGEGGVRREREGGRKEGQCQREAETKTNNTA